MTEIDSARGCCRVTTALARDGTACGRCLTIYNAVRDPNSGQGPPMNRLQTVAAALIVVAVAGSGCTTKRTLPTELAPSRVTTLGVNSYLWRAAIDTVS